jgi:hypothetical protein
MPGLFTYVYFIVVAALNNQILVLTEDRHVAERAQQTGLGLVELETMSSVSGK